MYIDGYCIACIAYYHNLSYCMSVRQKDSSASGPDHDIRTEWVIERRRENCVFGSRTTHVTRPAPLCFSHTAWHEQSYIHMVAFTRASPSSNFPLLMIHSSEKGTMFVCVLAAAYGITNTFLISNIKRLRQRLRSDCIFYLSFYISLQLFSQHMFTSLHLSLF